MLMVTLALVLHAAPTDKEFAAQARAASREPERAVSLVVACLAAYPDSAECEVAAGSAYARRAAVHQSSADQQEARRHYERFLTLAKPGDDRIAKVKTILAASR